MTDADKKLYDKAVEALDQMGAGLTSEIEKYVPAWIDGYQEGLKAKINATAISDCPVKDEWHKVADGDLPKNSDDKKLYLVYLGENDYGVAQFNNSRWWSFDDGWFDAEEVIAWCELPKFEEV